MRNYKDFPKTVGEIRSDKTNNSKDWTPRECLIGLLREIDEGTFTPDKMIIITHTDETDEKDEYTRASYAGELPIHERLGLLEVVKGFVFSDL